MDLILWRHAEAHDPTEGQDDLDRALTRRGEKQAARMAAWLDRQLPAGTRVLVSPARRTVQTVQPLARPYKLHDELRPGAGAADALQLAGWPSARSPVLLVGHQPTLGEVVAQLLGLPASACPMRKGGVWWLRSRERHGCSQLVVLTVQHPDLL